MDLLDWLEYGFLRTGPHLGKNLSLPEMPDLARLKAFQMEVNERVVRDEF